MASATDQFPCSISLRVPLPTARLASTALQALRVDPELSPLVQRRLSVASDQDAALEVDYQATTNRMLRVAVNSFMDSLGLVLDVMQQLDVDVLPPAENQNPS
ncbi:EKC/KEOPS complex, subunit Pcc1 [Metarhizium album ARSEF 1941]|uniref:EKC/KEOPS complex, subunit Pcc1 n=1 Tax=Metarhizium album (strain ARSEF 1941) TaxID=1081103 RepID=A0A0B2X3V9_METAS|nr:EKC/KEOPS complex, subunit Pcc1 [Metarhizium album ARSEF 1941]KHO00001.1 EKC/KEOPS complex, subunit Pcc1 [Metarhizium album ARSEF 1941]